VVLSGGVVKQAVVLTLIAFCWARSAWSCGVTAGGAPGISGCSLEEHEEAARRKWHLGSSYAFSSTGLRFSDEQRLGEERHVSLVTVDYRPVRRGTVSAGAGVFIGGNLSSGSARYDFDPGFIGVLGGSWRVWDRGRAGPFALLTGQLSYASTRVQGARYDAFDLRAGVVAGTTLWRLLTPYLVGRAFGGPVFWRHNDARVTGTDTHHYQVGGGLAMLLFRRLDVFAEGVPLGEQGLAVGAGLSF
jgi:hypothetical protein